MGMAESFIFPFVPFVSLLETQADQKIRVASILTVMWYSNSEQVVRLAFWNNQVRSFFTFPRPETDLTT